MALIPIDSDGWMMDGWYSVSAMQLANDANAKTVRTRKNACTTTCGDRAKGKDTSPCA